MPKLTVDGVGEFDVPWNKRMVLALIDEAGVDQLHSCGGHAKCTTCKVQFVSGEPLEMTEAERAVLMDRSLLNHAGLRLSCQIECRGDMVVKVISRFSESGKKDAGKRPGDPIDPSPVWTAK